MESIKDRYELIEVVASGGMATVWKARDTRLGRLVAVKRPHPGPPGDDSFERLNREARAAAALNHPNLITIYDFGNDSNGPYLVMELVDGPTLHEIGGRLEARDVVEMGARLAHALAAIHAAGIVHRDVKPANVIMSERGPLLTDFGIATDPSATAEITQPGTVVATPSYAAPEVLRGEPPTPASDVYSLGVVIDELVRKTGTSLEPSLDRAIAAALADSPADRPDAAGLADSLGGAAPAHVGVPSEGTTMILETTPSPPATPVASGGDRGRQRPPAWMWAAGALVLLGLGLTAVGFAISGDDQPADAAMPATTLVPGTSTTTSTTTSTSSTTTTTEPPLETAITDARDELETVLSRPPRSNLKPPEVEDIMKKVDEGIEAGLEGDLDKAAKKLGEADRRLEEKLDGDQLTDARTALHRLAGLFGIDLADADEDDDD